MKRGIFEFGFGWVFAVFVGAVIIVLAIYASTKFISQERGTQNAEVASQVGILLSPVETNLETGKTSTISFPSESRIYNDCLKTEPFGIQRISVSVSSGIGSKWEDAGVNSSFYNKYLFSSNPSQGKYFYILSKPYNLPFKVADLIFMWSDSEQYCFINPPTDIEDEITSLRPQNIEINSTCPVGWKKVCFDSGSNCDINVNTYSNSVNKQGKTVYYDGALIYGAIFSDPDLYECQVRRLMKRAATIAEVYASKSDTLALEGCNSNLKTDLLRFSQDAEAYSVSSVAPERAVDFRNVVREAGDLQTSNDALYCNLWGRQ